MSDVTGQEHNRTEFSEKSNHTLSHQHSGFARIAVAAILLVALGYYCCFTADPKNKNFTASYYPAMAESWIKGRLDQGVTPPAGFLDLKDPYDHVANAPFRNAGIHDLSYYRGKFYMYWGPTPTLVAFLPWRVITGQPLSTASAAWGFSVGAFLAATILISRAVGRYFPGTTRANLFLVLLSIGVCNFIPVVLRRPGVWEIPILAAVCFGTLSWMFLAEALAEERSKTKWLFLAGLCFGLAVGARPNWIVGAIVLLVPAWFSRKTWKTFTFWRELVIVLAPLAITFGLLLLLNWLRFDSPFEFGIKYQLHRAVDQAHLPRNALKFFAPESALYNLYLYLTAPPTLLKSFPFIGASSTADHPAGYIGAEETFGLLVILPFLWCVALGLLNLRRNELRRLLAVPALAFLSLIGILSMYAGVSTRYEVEVAVPLVILAALGFLSESARVGLTPIRRWISRWYLAGALVFSLLTTTLINLQHLDFLFLRNPSGYNQIENFSNEIALNLGWSRHAYLSGIELNFKTPSAKIGGPEIVLGTVGKSSAQMLIVTYKDNSTVHFSVQSFVATADFPDVTLDRTKTHILKVEMGSFYPPSEHPSWGNTSGTEKYLARKTFRLWIDGQLAISTPVLSPEPMLKPPMIGRSDEEWAYGMDFTGEISQRSATEFFRE